MVEQGLVSTKPEQLDISLFSVYKIRDLPRMSTINKWHEVDISIYDDIGSSDRKQNQGEQKVDCRTKPALPREP